MRCAHLSQSAQFTCNISRAARSATRNPIYEYTSTDHLLMLGSIYLIRWKTHTHTKHIPKIPLLRRPLSKCNNKSTPDRGAARRRSRNREDHFAISSVHILLRLSYHWFDCCCGPSFIYFLIMLNPHAHSNCAIRIGRGHRVAEEIIKINPASMIETPSKQPSGALGGRLL